MFSFVLSFHSLFIPQNLEYWSVWSEYLREFGRWISSLIHYANKQKRGFAAKLLRAKVFVQIRNIFHKSEAFEKVVGVQVRQAVYN